MKLIPKDESIEEYLIRKGGEATTVDKEVDSTLDTEGRTTSPLKLHTAMRDCLCTLCHMRYETYCPRVRMATALERALEVMG